MLTTIACTYCSLKQKVTRTELNNFAVLKYSNVNEYTK